VTRYCSPAIDLIYFLAVCTDGPTRANHYNELLNLYYDTFETTLNNHLGGDAARQFPKPEFLRQVKRYGKFGIVMATLLIAMQTAPKGKLPDMDYMADNMQRNQDPREMLQVFSNLTIDNKAYEERMRDTLMDAFEYGYFDD
jgi:hypothetical protein